MTAPAFAIPWRGQEPLDKFFVGASGTVAQERIDLLQRGWQSGEVKGYAANERAFVRRERRRKSAGFDARQNEAIEIVVWPALVVDGRHRPSSKRLERPV